jgi:hypothetical protein
MALDFVPPAKLYDDQVFYAKFHQSVQPLFLKNQTEKDTNSEKSISHLTSLALIDFAIQNSNLNGTHNSHHHLVSGYSASTPRYDFFHSLLI